MANLRPRFPAELTLDSRLRYVAEMGEGPVLNLGSGVNPIQGAVNHVFAPMDQSVGDQVGFDLTRFPWPVPKDTYLMVCAFHVLEHIPVGVSLRFMEECWRVLVLGGALVLEVPDIVGQARELVQGHMGMLGWMYGQYQMPGEGHLWGWDASQLMIVSRLAGFRLCVTKPGTDYHSVQIPTVRLEAVKSERVTPHDATEDPAG